MFHMKYMERDIDNHPLFHQPVVGSKKRIPNHRKLGELPHALLGAGDRERLVQRLCDFDVFHIFSSDLVRAGVWGGSV